MTRIRFEDLPSTNTPRNAENLNKLNNVAISSTEPNTGEEVWIQKGKNLFNGIYQRINGLGIDNTGYFSRGDQLLYVIPITQDNNIYTFSFESSVQSGYFTLANEIPTGTSSTHSTRTAYTSNNNRWRGTYTNSNYKYLIIGLQVNNEASNIQIEQNSTATSYEAYIDKKIYTKNDNGVYEEFYDESEVGKEVYSTTEQVIGTWMGKPLYRKVVEYTLLDNAGDYPSVSTGILNSENVFIKIERKYGDNNRYVSGITCYNGYFDRNDGSFTFNRSNNDATKAEAGYYVLIFEYTKTTD